jgi:hypothetical protein
MNNWRICWFSRIFLLGILICKGLVEGRLYKSFGVKGLTRGSAVGGQMGNAHCSVDGVVRRAVVFRIEF